MSIAYDSNKQADRYVALALSVWWIINLLQATFTELAHDEAYYYMFAENLDWGYFDHPPMTALLIALGGLLGGELGVRFFFTCLQPIYLWILWIIIRTRYTTTRDAILFIVISAALPILQLYGFLAVPDVPLMMTTALYLLCYKRFTEKETWLNVIFLGITMALMAYSKYHGALVVLFTVVVNPKLFLRPRLYISAFITLILILPHLYWQYTHDFISFEYHFHDRNGSFKVANITEHLLNTFAVFNPFFFPLYFMAWKHIKNRNATERALYFLPILFFLFFTMSTFKGRVQPQWLIAATFGLVFLLYRYIQESRSSRLHKYVLTVGWITIALAGIMRIEMIWNPINIRFEIFDNKPSFANIADIAGNRPVIFGGSYAIASKYIFYTGKEAYCQPDFAYRTSQWQLRDDDTQAVGKEVITGALQKIRSKDRNKPLGSNEIALANGYKFSYAVIDSFKPSRLVDIAYESNTLPGVIYSGDTLSYTLKLHNPYPYDIAIAQGDTYSLRMLMAHKKTRIDIPIDTSTTIPAHGDASIDIQVVIPENIESHSYDMGFSIAYKPIRHWYNSRRTQLTVCEKP